MADRSTEPEKIAKRAVADAREHLDRVTREYGEAFSAAIQREQERARAELGGRRAVYAQGGVLVRLTDREVKLRQQVQRATVCVTEAESAYRKTCIAAYLRPRR